MIVWLKWSSFLLFDFDFFLPFWFDQLIGCHHPLLVDHQASRLDRVKTASCHGKFVTCMRFVLLGRRSCPKTCCVLSGVVPRLRPSVCVCVCACVREAEACTAAVNAALDATDRSSGKHWWHQRAGGDCIPVYLILPITWVGRFLWMKLATWRS